MLDKMQGSPWVGNLTKETHMHIYSKSMEGCVRVWDRSASRKQPELQPLFEMLLMLQWHTHAEQKPRCFYSMLRNKAFSLERIQRDLGESHAYRHYLHTCRTFLQVSDTQSTKPLNSHIASVLFIYILQVSYFYSDLIYNCVTIWLLVRFMPTFSKDVKIKMEFLQLNLAKQRPWREEPYSYLSVPNSGKRFQQSSAYSESHGGPTEQILQTFISQSPLMNWHHLPHRLCNQSFLCLTATYITLLILPLKAQLPSVSLQACHGTDFHALPLLNQILPLQSPFLSVLFRLTHTYFNGILNFKKNLYVSTEIYRRIKKAK